LFFLVWKQTIWQPRSSSKNRRELEHFFLPEITK
jgi:hypothetical protein